jgi:hypothetical protein
VEAGVRDQQPAEAVPHRLGSGNGMEWRRKWANLRKIAQITCNKPPTEFLPARHNSKPAAHIA